MREVWAPNETWQTFIDDALKARDSAPASRCDSQAD
jgi:hypothetical protein